MNTNFERRFASRSSGRTLSLRLGLALACLSILAPALQAATPAKTTAVPQRTFNTPEEAAEALVSAAEQFDLPVLKEILGPEGTPLVSTQDAVQDKEQAVDFAAQARQKLEIVRDPKNPQRVTMAVGPDAWPSPIPIVSKSGKWRFDSKAGAQEVMYRRIGANELDAIDVCEGYAEAQYEYASERRAGATVTQYAQRIISTKGKQDGLAWQAPDGTWQGPVGEEIARVIAEGYTDRYKPYHGYYYKILKGQGPAAAMGAMDFVVDGIMIGGFALVASPAEYSVTGVKSFIISGEGVVYEKDLGPKTLEMFRSMELYNPDSTWTPVEKPAP